MRSTRFLLFIGTITIGLIAVITALTILWLVAAASIRIILPQPNSNSDDGILNTIATWGYQNQPSEFSVLRDPEYQAAIMDDDAIVLWIRKCATRLLDDPQFNSKVKDRLDSSNENLSLKDLVVVRILPIASDLQTLSESLIQARITNAKKAADAYYLLQVSILITIALGLATTVLVSLSTTEFGQEKSTLGRVIRVFAIILPAVGTAVAAISAFYAPREDLARSSQALASVRQIHDQIASEIGAIQCPTPAEAGQNVGEIALKLYAWKKLVLDARSLAEAAALAAVDRTRNQVPDIESNKGLNNP